MARSLPGRGVAVHISHADWGTGYGIGLAPVGRSFWVDDVHYRPGLLDPVVISRGQSVPLSYRFTWSTVRLAVEHSSLWIADYIGDPLAGARLEGATVLIYREAGGTFDPSTDLIWRGFVGRENSVRADGGVVTIECIDALGWYLDGKAVGGERRLNEDDHDDLSEDYPEVFEEFQGVAWPRHFGRTRTRARDASGPCVPVKEKPAAWIYQYEDTRDLNGGKMEVPEDLEAVYAWDTETYEEIKTGLRTANRIEMSTAISQTTAQRNRGQFKLDKSAAVADLALAGIVIADFDDAAVQRFRLFARFPAAARTNDSTVVAAFSAYDGEADWHYRTERLVGTVLRLLIEHCGMPASSIYLSDLEQLNFNLGTDNYTVARKLDTAIPVDQCLAELCEEFQLRIGMGTDGLVHIERAPLVPSGAADYTINPRQQIADPEVELGAWGDRFTSLVLSQERGFWWDDGEGVGIRTVRGENSAALSLNGSVPVPREIQSFWLGARGGMRHTLDEWLFAQGHAPDLVRIRVAARTGEEDDLLDLLPGDVASYWHDATLVAGASVRDIGAEGDLWRVVGIEANETDQTSTLILWRVQHVATEYDATVASSGGDYTSIATALSAQGTGKTVLVKRGTYAESDDVVILVNQRVVFDDVTISLSGDAQVRITGDGATCEGTVTIDGTGDSADQYRILHVSGDNFNGRGCMFRVRPDAIAPNVATVTAVVVTGDKAQLNVEVADYAVTAGATVSTVAAVCCSAVLDSAIDVVVDTVTDDEPAVSSCDVVGLWLTGNSLRNACRVSVQDVTSDNGNRGIGILVDAGSNYNVLLGASLGADSANLTDNGTDTQKGEIAT